MYFRKLDGLFLNKTLWRAGLVKESNGSLEFWGTWTLGDIFSISYLINISRIKYKDRKNSGS
jgi:hypothetical protein